MREIRVDQLVGRGDPDRPALTFKDVTLSYRELADRVGRLAAGLRALGVLRGDRVAVYAEKRIDTVVALLATSAAGAAFVPVNPLFKARHLAHVIEDCTPRLVITTPERADTVRDASADVPVVVFGSDQWRTLTETVPAPAPGDVIDQDVAAIMYTSGSTGGPKGVVLSHRNILAGAESVATYLKQRPDDVVLAALPLSFDAGFSQLTTSFLVGAHVVLVNYLLPKEVVKLCAKHGVTGLTCVPPLWLQLVTQDWPAESVAGLRYFANTGGRMPRATLARLREIFPAAEPYLMYGLTEAFRSTYLDPAEADRRPDSIGKAIPNAEILVVRPDGTPCEPGEQGELVHRGALVAQGYWRDPVRTAERFRPLPTSYGTEIAVWSGDTVVKDEDGFLYFVGRGDDMIKTSGYRVSPTEIEEAAYATGLVGEAVALGVDDERLGQHIVLVATLLGDAGDLAGKLAEALPAYMLPHRIEVRDQLPRSVNGKFDRHLLAKELSC
ncbi:acyl-CoA ligase (AMP-forming), exosortase A system-associated [Kutzneria kofuensis]|uniref:Acyl-CoA ligase (AMP-forming) (Exosortase A-associated) n=1 Tax=Kutzneria kofuensis TaxID=103725 RepID=A0A7W9KNH8_9PSEU|nr:acyl-CoA ligase (AMP-forming), exosortase A system-associated [Kutzneria kofuensis]MBB5895816.1 acyl-CoA ligase (AMP-forming) (exosortase A-associated) [Kutzneria kofuensis]